MMNLYLGAAFPPLPTGGLVFVGLVVGLVAGLVAGVDCWYIEARGGVSVSKQQKDLRWSSRSQVASMKMEDSSATPTEKGTQQSDEHGPFRLDLQGL